MATEQLFRRVRAHFGCQVAPPDPTKAILSVPVGVVRVDFDDLQQFRVVIALADPELVARLDLHEAVVLGRVRQLDGLPEPDADESVGADRHNFLRVAHEDLRDGSFVARPAVLAADLQLDESVVPHQHVAPLAPGQNLFVWHRANPVNVADFRLAEPADQTLQLQAGERGRHLPKLDVTEPARRQLLGNERREHQVDDIVGEGFRPQFYFLPLPVPDGDGVVRIAAFKKKLKLGFEPSGDEL